MKEASSSAYAQLNVELLVNKSTTFPDEALLFIFHKLDFRNLWGVFMDRGVSTDEEVLVVYSPCGQRTKLGRLLSSFLPKFVIGIYPKGSLERIQDWLQGRNAVTNLPEPIEEYDARPDNPFLR